MTKEERKEYSRLWYLANRDRVLAGKAADKERRRERDRNRPEKVKAKQKEYLKRYYLEHREEIIARTRAREKADPEQRRKDSKRWQDNNPEKRNKSVRAYMAANPDKVKAARKAWYNANSKRWAAYATARRAALLQRTPLWADLDAITQVYVDCPNGMHVDHIYPLCGKTVSGLHIASNLRFSDAIENKRKGNRMPTPQEVAQWDTEMDAWRNGLSKAA